MEDSGEDKPALQQELLGKPEWEITNTALDEALEDVLLPAAEDKPENANASNDVDDKLTKIAPDEELGNALENASKRMQNLELSRIADSSCTAMFKETSLKTSLERLRRLPLKTSLEIEMKILKILLRETIQTDSDQIVLVLYTL